MYQNARELQAPRVTTPKPQRTRRTQRNTFFPCFLGVLGGFQFYPRYPRKSAAKEGVYRVATAGWLARTNSSEAARISFTSSGLAASE
jgi:hypothetical protein